MMTGRGRTPTIFSSFDRRKVSEMSRVSRGRRNPWNITGVACALVLGVTAPAAAAPISDRYDGMYEGALRINDALSAPNCSSLSRLRVEVSEGNLWGYDENGERIARGWVTADGFFTGEYTLPDGVSTRFEGLVDTDGNFVGGVVNNGCAWLAELSRSTSNVAS